MAVPPTEVFRLRVDPCGRYCEYTRKVKRVESANTSLPHAPFSRNEICPLGVIDEWGEVYIYSSLTLLLLGGPALLLAALMALSCLFLSVLLFCRHREPK